MFFSFWLFFFLFLFVCLFVERGSGLKTAINLRLVLNCWSSCLHLSNAGITGMHHHTQVLYYASEVATCFSKWFISFLVISFGGAGLGKSFTVEAGLGLAPRDLRIKACLSDKPRSFPSQLHGW